MRKFKLLFLSSLLHASLLMGGEITSQECRGGDGPVPLNDVSSQFSGSASQISTAGEVQNFLYWNRKRRLVYRNEKNELHQLNLQTSVGEKIGEAEEALSRVIDTKEHLILQKNATRYLDISNGNEWTQYSTHHPISHHLYWSWDFDKGDVLYSLASVFLTPSIQTVEIYSYSKGESEVTSCSLPTTQGEYFHVANGHVFPFVFLYQTVDLGQETEIRFFEVRLAPGLLVAEKCALSQVGKSIRVPGRVKKVHRFKLKNSVAIVTDSPNKALVWVTPKSCTYYDLGAREPLFISQQYPVLGTWESKEGVQLVFLSRREKATLLKNFNQTPVDEQDMLLSSDGKRVFFNVKWKNSAKKKLFLKYLNR